MGRLNEKKHPFFKSKLTPFHHSECTQCGKHIVSDVDETDALCVDCSLDIYLLP